MKNVMICDATFQNCLWNGFEDYSWDLESARFWLADGSSSGLDQK